MRHLVSILACGWPAAPLLAAMIRGSGYWLVIDSAMAIGVSGILLLLLAIRYRRSGVGITGRRDSLSAVRVAVTGITMLGLGLIGLLTELHLLIE